MKNWKLSFRLLIITFAIIVFGNVMNTTTVSAETTIGTAHTDEFKYYYDDTDSTVAITSYIGDAETVVIPSQIDGKSVTSIDGNAFARHSQLTSITIPDSVTSIGIYAFKGCSHLTSITIPDSVTCIDAFAFEDCYCLTNIIIPNGVTSIEMSTFYNCSSLTSITIPDSVTSIGYEAFRGCSSLTSITIPNSVTRINTGAFLGCGALTNIALSNNLKGISSKTFYDCSSLSSITIPDGVTSIGKYAFCGCSSLKGIAFPDSVTEIEDNVFVGCGNLSIIIPKSVTNIGGGLFSNYSYQYIRTAKINIYFTGTEHDWEQIVVDSSIDDGAIITLHYDSIIPDKITLDVHKLELSDEKPYALTASISPEDATVEKIIWISSNSNIVYCSDDGELTARSNGTVTVTAMTVNGLTDSVEITVSNLHNCDINGHIKAIIPSVPATCTEDGLTEGTYCSICGTVIKEQEVIPTLGEHQWGLWLTITPATATTDGEQMRTCIICKISETRVLPKTPLTPDETPLPSATPPTPPTPVPTDNPTSTNQPQTTGQAIPTPQPQQTTTPQPPQTPQSVSVPLSQVKKLTAKNKKKKTVTLSWKNVSNASGYELQYATNKKFKSSKKKVSKKTKITVKGLKKKKTYFFRVRSYRWNGSKKVYGKWSVIKKVKIKK